MRDEEATRWNLIKERMGMLHVTAYHRAKCETAFASVTRESSPETNMLAAGLLLAVLDNYTIEPQFVATLSAYASATKPVVPPVEPAKRLSLTPFEADNAIWGEHGWKLAYRYDFPTTPKGEIGSGTYLTFTRNNYTATWYPAHNYVMLRDRNTDDNVKIVLGTDTRHSRLLYIARDPGLAMTIELLAIKHPHPTPVSERTIIADLLLKWGWTCITLPGNSMRYARRIPLGNHSSVLYNVVLEGEGDNLAVYLEQVGTETFRVWPVDFKCGANRYTAYTVKAESMALDPHGTWTRLARIAG